MVNEILYQIMLSDTLRLEQHFTGRKGKSPKWETRLYNTRTNMSLLLDSITDENSGRYDDDSARRHRYYRICGATLYDNVIYAVYQNFGFTSLKYFTFSGPNSFTLKELPVNLALISDLWGPPKGYAAFARIDDDLYFFVDVNRMVEKILFKFSLKKKRISVIRFQDQIKLMTPENLFKQTDLSHNEQYIKEHIQPIFIQYYEIRNILSLKYLGFIESEAEFEQNGSRYFSGIYFFAELDHQLHILRYQCYQKEWLLSGFKDEPLIYDQNNPGKFK